MKKTRLKAKEINKQLKQFSPNLNKKDQVELVEGEFKIIQINNVPSFFYYQNNKENDLVKVIPTLQYLQNHKVLKIITVDMGAVKFVVNGADIMRPGITTIEENIQKDEFIVVVDENNQKPLSVGIALSNSEEIRNTKSGKVIKNIHYIGDKIWKNENH